MTLKKNVLSDYNGQVQFCLFQKRQINLMKRSEGLSTTTVFDSFIIKQTINFHYLILQTHYRHYHEVLFHEIRFFTMFLSVDFARKYIDFTTIKMYHFKPVPNGFKKIFAFFNVNDISSYE